MSRDRKYLLSVKECLLYSFYTENPLPTREQDISTLNIIPTHIYMYSCHDWLQSIRYWENTEQTLEKEKCCQLWEALWQHSAETEVITQGTKLMFTRTLWPPWPSRLKLSLKTKLWCSSQGMSEKEMELFSFCWRTESVTACFYNPAFQGADCFCSSTTGEARSGEWTLWTGQCFVWRQLLLA